MTELIKDRNIFYAYLIYSVDVRIEGGVFAELGRHLSGADVLFHAVVETVEVVE